MNERHEPKDLGIDTSHGQVSLGAPIDNLLKKEPLMSSGYRLGISSTRPTAQRLTTQNHSSLHKSGQQNDLASSRGHIEQQCLRHSFSLDRLVVGLNKPRQFALNFHGNSFPTSLSLTKYLPNTDQHGWLGNDQGRKCRFFNALSSS